MADTRSTVPSLQTNASMSEKPLLEFPCQFPIKVMGKSGFQLDILVIDIICRHADNADIIQISQRPSAQGNYVAVSVTLTASSRPQLDAIYLDLTSQPEILMVL